MENLNNCNKCDKRTKFLIELNCIHKYCKKCISFHMNKNEKTFYCLKCEKNTMVSVKKIKEIFSKKSIKKKNTNDKLEILNYNYSHNNSESNSYKNNSILNISRASIKNSQKIESQKLIKTHEQLNNSISKEIIVSNEISKIDSEFEIKNTEVYVNKIENEVNNHKKELNKLLLLKNEIIKTNMMNKLQMKKFFNKIIDKVKKFEKETEQNFDLFLNQFWENINNSINDFKKTLKKFKIFNEKITIGNKSINNDEFNNLMNFKIENDIVDNLQSSFNNNYIEKFNNLNKINLKFNKIFNYDDELEENIEDKFTRANLKLNYTNIEENSNYQDNLNSKNLTSRLYSRNIKDKSDYRSIDKSSNFQNYKKSYYLSKNPSSNLLLNKNYQGLDLSKTIINNYNKKNYFKSKNKEIRKLLKFDILKSKFMKN